MVDNIWEIPLICARKCVTFSVCKYYLLKYIYLISSHLVFGNVDQLWMLLIMQLKAIAQYWRTSLKIKCDDFSNISSILHKFISLQI